MFIQSNQPVNDKKIIYDPVGMALEIQAIIRPSNLRNRPVRTTVCQPPDPEPPASG
jgi:hypothetical protein